jgi:hypothetical protein
MDTLRSILPHVSLLKRLAAMTLIKLQYLIWLSHRDPQVVYERGVVGLGYGTYPLRTVAGASQQVLIVKQYVWEPNSFLQVCPLEVTVVVNVSYHPSSAIPWRDYAAVLGYRSAGHARHAHPRRARAP